MISLQTAYDEFIIAKQIAGLTPKTLSCYASFVSPFINALGTSTDVLTLPYSRIQDYLLSLHQRELSKATLATYTRHIKAF